MMFYSRKHCFRVSETGEENYINDYSFIMSCWMLLSSQPHSLEVSETLEENFANDY
jgi:hypothetical protein